MKRSSSTVALLGLIGFLLGWNVWSAGFFDFAVYERAARQTLAGVTLYAEPGHFQYKYSPFVAAILAGLYRPFWMLGLSGTGLARVFYEVWGGLWVLWIARAGAARSAAGTVLGLVFFWNALRYELELGQINILPVGLLWWVIRQVARPDGPESGLRRGGVALALSLAIQIKLYCLIVGPWLLWRRRWDLIAGSAAWMLVCNPLLYGVVTGSQAFAWQETLDWVRTLTASSANLLYFSHNIAWIGFVGKATGSDVAAKVAWFGMFLGFLGLQYRWRNERPAGQWALHAFGVVILTPLVWSNWVLMLWPTVSRLFRRFAEDKSARVPLGMLLAFSWLAFNAQHAAISRDVLQPLAILGLAAFALGGRGRYALHDEEIARPRI